MKVALITAAIVVGGLAAYEGAKWNKIYRYAKSHRRA